MIQKLLESLKASVRDIVLAGVAAAAGYFLAQEMPKSLDEFGALVAAALYMGLRAAVAFAVALLSRD